MRSLTSLLGLLACLHNVSAQTTTVRSSVSTTTSKAFHTVAVGFNGHSFNPDTVYANVGDTIVFEFIAKGHSVVKAMFGQPCIPYNTLNRGEPSFFSGFFREGTNSQNPPTWNLTVNSTEPTFYYCSKDTSCLDNQMIGVINPNSTFSLAAQKSNIGTNDTIMLQPGEPLPTEGNETPTKLSTGAIVGIAIGAAVIIILLLATLLWFIRRRRHRNLKTPTQEVQPPHSHPTVSPWLDNQSTAYAPSSVGHHSYNHNSVNGMMRPPSYLPGSPEPWEKQALWSHGPIYHPQIQELGTPDAVELDEGVGGRSRERDVISEVVDPKVVAAIQALAHEKD